MSIGNDKMVLNVSVNLNTIVLDNNSYSSKHCFCTASLRILSPQEGNMGYFANWVKLDCIPYQFYLKV